MVTVFDHLEECELRQALLRTILHELLHHKSDPVLIFLGVETQDLLYLAELEVESVDDQPEEGVGKGEGEEPDDENSNQLDSQELASALRKQTLLLMDQAICDHAPNATEEMCLCRLQRVIKLELIQYLGAEEVDQATCGTNYEGRVDLNLA